MRTYRVMGIRPYSFFDDKVQRQVSGVSLFLASPFPETEGYANALGEETIKTSVSMAIWDTFHDTYKAYPQIGDELHVLYNPYGKVDCLIAAGAFPAA